MLVQSGSGDKAASLKLKKDEITSIIDTVFQDVIKPQLDVLNEKIQKRKALFASARDDESSSEEENPQMKSFLKAIDLGDDSEDGNEALLQS
jgi:hypothetical protein